MIGEASPRYVVGVDIGGTFTDCVVLASDGRVAIGKVPSTPPHFEAGFIASIRKAAARMGIADSELYAAADGIYHGCTIGTNALVEGRTAKVGLLSTAGHGDTLAIMQGGGRLLGLDPRYVAHVAAHTKPPPLVPKQLVAEIDERIAFDGNVIVALHEERCRSEIRSLLAAGVEAFAVCFLWSIVNAANEQRAAELIREEAPGAFVSVSAEVIARKGEYPRAVATVINALIGPVTSAYLLELEGQLASLGYEGTLYIMSCTGGVITSGRARSLPLLTIGSGPVAGLIGAGTLARASSSSAGGSGPAGSSNAGGRPAGSSDAGGHRAAGLDVLTADMGGTTFDVGVIRRGQPIARPTTRHGQYEYFVPTLDIRSIGAGGGSIIHFDRAIGSLRVGPRSAGAVPGPASYLRGGIEATVTDADLVLGYLNPEYFLGGDLSLGLAAAREALERAGQPLGFGAEQTAAAAARIVDNQMADAIRLASIQQGYDPREYVMYAYGGAGAVHGPAVARALGIPKLVVPLGDLASGWSAFGVASSDALVVQEAPIVLAAPFDHELMNAAWRELERSVSQQLEQQAIAAEDVLWERAVDIRYGLQISELTIPAPRGSYDATTAGSLVEAFELEYERLFGQGTGYAAAGFTLTSMRVSARARISELELGAARVPAAGEADAGARAGRAARTDQEAPAEREARAEREVIWYERGLEPASTPVLDGAALALDGALEGPAIVEFVDTTLVLRHAQSARVDEFGSIVIEVFA